MARREPEPGVQELFDAIASCFGNAIGFDGVVFRSSSMSYATVADFLSGKGAAKYGGRWNSRGVEAAYASTTIGTAVKEAYQNILRYGFSPSTIRPRVLAGAEITLGTVLDLTNSSIRKRLGFTLTELIEEDWKGIQEEGDESWSQAIGRGAYEAGFEGVLVPSAQDRPAGTNLVIYPGNLGSDSRIDILGKDDLPRHP